MTKTDRARVFFLNGDVHELEIYPVSTWTPENVARYGGVTTSQARAVTFHTTNGHHLVYPLAVIRYIRIEPLP